MQPVRTAVALILACSDRNIAASSLRRSCSPTLPGQPRRRRPHTLSTLARVRLPRSLCNRAPHRRQQPPRRHRISRRRLLRRRSAKRAWTCSVPCLVRSTRTHSWSRRSPAPTGMSTALSTTSWQRKMRPLRPARATTATGARRSATASSSRHGPTHHLFVNLPAHAPRPTLRPTLRLTLRASTRGPARGAASSLSLLRFPLRPFSLSLSPSHSLSLPLSLSLSPARLVPLSLARSPIPGHSPPQHFN
mmetsp:Transcript_13523/g.43139  ORF Transcript_13523/g.43139 Transcript_13523/m.43139 type:complete len:248 (-) Transcript_13523:49-792(-)